MVNQADHQVCICSCALLYVLPAGPISRVSCASKVCNIGIMLTSPPTLQGQQAGSATAGSPVQTTDLANGTSSLGRG